MNLDSVKIPIISEDQTAPGFASATANTKKFSRSAGQMADQYKTESGKAFRAVSQGLSVSTFGFLSLAGVAYKTVSSINEFRAASIKAYTESGIASASYSASIRAATEAEKDFKIAVGSSLSGLVEKWNWVKSNVLGSNEGAIKAGNARIVAAAGQMQSYLAGTLKTRDEQIRAAIELTANMDEKKRAYILSGIGTVDEVRAIFEKIKAEQKKQLDDMAKMKEDELKRQTAIQDRMYWGPTATEGMPGTLPGFESFIKGGENSSFYANGAKKGYIGEMRTGTFKALNESKKDWLSYGQTVGDVLNMVASTTKDRSSEIINGMSGIGQSLFAMAASGGNPLGMISAGASLLTSVFGMFNSSSDRQAEQQAKQTAAAKTAARYDSVTRQGPTVNNFNPTIVIQSTNGVQLIGDSQVTSQTLTGLVIQALQRGVANNQISLSGLAPAGAGA